MTTATDRQALIEKANRVRKCVYLAAEESVADDISHTIGQLLEALSSSAPVETPLVATDAESEPHKPKIRVHETMGGFWRVVVSGRDENQDDRYALMPLGRGQTRAEAVANARAWFAQVDPASPADPPIPSPGDEERKDEIAKRAADATIGTVFRLPYTKARFRANLEEAAYRALSDYEIKAGAKSSPPAPSGWQPIESAPKNRVIDVWLGDADEDEVQFYCTPGTRRSCGWKWHQGRFRPVTGLGVPVVTVKPTHWMALPPTPTQEHTS